MDGRHLGIHRVHRCRRNVTREDGPSNFSGSSVSPAGCCPAIEIGQVAGAHFILETNVHSLLPSATPRCKEGIKGEKPLAEPAFAFLKLLFQHGRIEHQPGR
jgi:hypothetical protein